MDTPLSPINRHRSVTDQPEPNIHSWALTAGTHSPGRRLPQSRPDNNDAVEEALTDALVAVVVDGRVGDLRVLASLPVQSKCS